MKHKQYNLIYMFQENLKILLEADYGSWVLNQKVKILCMNALSFF